MTTTLAPVNTCVGCRTEPNPGWITTYGTAEAFERGGVISVIECHVCNHPKPTNERSPSWAGLTE